IAMAGRVGGDPTYNLDVVEIYDPETDSWREGAPVPTPRSGVAAVALDGIAYVFGGETRQVTFAEAEAYDPATDTWTTLPPLPTPRHGFGAAVHDGRIYTLMGAPNAGADSSTLVEVFTPTE